MLHELNIPKKSLFKLEEVCSLTGVKPYVLRFWESEFDEISPLLSSTGQKLYEHKDIESVLIIKSLLFDKKMTIEQAKKEIKNIRPVAMTAELLSSAVAPLDSFEATQISAVSSSNPVLKMELSHSELQKLEDAKIALNKILKRTQDIKLNHNWS